MSSPPLKGIKVLDFGRFIAGPYCAALLADMGADVIRVDPVEGADDRHVTPIDDTPDGATYLPMNRNKRSLAIDIHTPHGREILQRLLRETDVVVANMPERALRKLELDYASLSALNPLIVLTSVSAFGTQGPEADSVGFDGTGQAMSGAMSLTGLPGQPTRSATSYVDVSTAISAALGTVGALFARVRTGRGQHVQASLLRTALAIMNPILMEQASGSRNRVATGNRSPISGPSDSFATRDGWIMVQVVGQLMFERWCDAIGAADFRNDPRFADDLLRGENGAALSARMSTWCASRTTDECMRSLRAARVPVCRILSPAEALVEPQNAEGGFFQWFDVENVANPLPLVAPLVMLSDAPASLARIAPALGAHTHEIVGALGFEDAQITGFEAERIIHCAAGTR